MWVIGNYARGNAEFPVWKGWAIAAGLGGTGYVMTLLHHQIFWYASLPNLDSTVFQLGLECTLSRSRIAFCLGPGMRSI